MDVTFTTHSAQETMELGLRIGGRLRGGEVFAVCGPLGSGKTHLIKGIAAGAGTEDQRDVTSPTFVIVNEYHGRLDIFHLDAYRLDSITEFEMLGFDDFCDPGSVVLIEWADKVEPAIRGIGCIRVDLSHAGKYVRKLRFQNVPDYLDIT